MGGPQDKCHPQTIALCQTRAEALGLVTEVGDEGSFQFTSDVCGVLLQYPATDGSIHNYKASRRQVHVGEAVPDVVRMLCCCCVTVVLMLCC